VRGITDEQIDFCRTVKSGVDAHAQCATGSVYGNFIAAAAAELQRDVGGGKGHAHEFAYGGGAAGGKYKGVWLIGLDATGTVPTSDIDFIHEIGHEKKKIYVVLNKADLKPDEEMQAIMDEVEDILVNEQGFEIEGICAYVSNPTWKRPRMVGHRKLELMDYFARINRPSDACEHLRKRLDGVFAMYEESLNNDIEQIKSIA